MEHYNLTDVRYEDGSHAPYSKVVVHVTRKRGFPSVTFSFITNDPMAVVDGMTNAEMHDLYGVDDDGQQYCVRRAFVTNYSPTGTRGEGATSGICKTDEVPF